MKVTILILIDGFLQCIYDFLQAMQIDVTILILIDGFLQLGVDDITVHFENRHNPYFNRWFSAISPLLCTSCILKKSQSLF